jgi:NADH-quinone oxidoreductase subunit L
MAVLRALTDWHILMWAVPAVCAVLLAALGSRLSNRWLHGLALTGNGLCLLQALAAQAFFLFGPTGGYDNQVRIDWLAEAPFQMVFRLDETGAWAALVLAGVTLAAQLHAAAMVSRLGGRHRFAALLQIGLAAGCLLCCAGSPLVLLVGWEGQALAAAFLAGFWEPEAGGGRVGMRWLLFQRLSGVLLTMGVFGLVLDLDVGLALVLAGVLVRAGQFPFHGWLPEVGQVPAPAAALIHGAWSTLPAVFLLIRSGGLIQTSAWAPEVLLGLALGGVLLGALAGLQQPEPTKALGWVFVMHGGLAFLGLALGDQVAAVLLVSGQAICLAGLTLAAGVLNDPLADLGAVVGLPTRWRGQWAFGVLALTSVLPPGLGWLGLGRLLVAAPEGAVGHLTLAAVGLAGLTSGWVCLRVLRQLRLRTAEAGFAALAANRWLALGPWLLAAAAAAAGGLVLGLHGEEAAGGGAGLVWGLLGAGGACLGGGLQLLLGQRRQRWLPGRLLRAQRVAQWLADSGLGIGAAVVQLPVMVARSLGVIVWRVLGEWVVDGLVVGTAYRTVQGIGMVLRGLQNGQPQRYTLLIAVAALALVLWMLR